MNDDHQHKSIGVSLRHLFESAAVGIGAGSAIIAAATQSSKPLTTMAIAFCAAYLFKN
jgi:hypothetical protein